MNPPSRPSHLSDEESAQRPAAAGAPAQTSRANSGGERRLGRFSSTGGGGGGEPESPVRRRSRTSVDSLGVFQTRSIFPRRSSSGYFSFDPDSLPSSPRPATADKATQTPSPSAQVMAHALLRAAGSRGDGAVTQRLHERGPSPSSTRRGHAAEDMHAEAFGQELRRIGDDFNRIILIRRAAGRHRPVVIRRNRLPHLHQEPTVLLCMGLVLLVIGRIIYLHGSTNGRDHSQVFVQRPPCTRAQQRGESQPRTEDNKGCHVTTIDMLTKGAALELCGPGNPNLRLHYMLESEVNNKKLAAREQ